MLIPFGAKASYYCNYNDRAKVKKLASNIVTTYNPIISGEKASFDITISNVFDNLIVRDVNSERNYSGSKEITIKNYQEGQSYKFEVYTDLENCNDEVMYVFYVNVPYYNPYYTDKLCDDIKEYSMCQKWMSYKVNYDKFKTNIAIYKNKADDGNGEEPNHEKSIFDEVVDFLLKYYPYILVTIIIVSLIQIYRLNKKNSFDL